MTTLMLLALIAAPDPGGVAFFEKKVRPVLVEHCYSCHSAEAQAKKKLRGGLLLDTREGLLRGGDTGPAIVPGKAKDSLLIQSLSHAGDLKMPPRQKLSDAVIRDLESWIERGAPDPRTGPTVRAKGLSIEEGKRFWAYRPVQAVAVPRLPMSNRATSEIDAFIQDRLNREGITVAPRVSRLDLIRRVTFDLTGLPPTPAEIESFENNSRPDAYERLVDRLLGSPAFGERWGRHWLDVARFAESLTLRGFVLDNAWRYRDLVIDSFNEDMPFDTFVRLQVAGDLLKASNTEEARRNRIATTFLALGNTNLEEQDKKQLRMDVVDEQLDTLGRAFLAQTLGCARCHDHKFDPVPTRDYYALAGILRNTRTLTHANVSKWLDIPLPANPEQEKAIAAHEGRIKALQEKIRLARATASKKPGKARAVPVAELPGIIVDDTKARKVGEWTASTYSGSFVGAGYVHDGNARKGEKTITFQPEIPKTGNYEVRLSWSAGTNRAKTVPVTIFSVDGEKTVFLDQTRQPEIDGLFHSLGVFRFEKTGQGFVLIASEDTTGHVVADAVQFLPVERLAEKTPPKNLDTSSLAALEAELKRLSTTGPRREMALSVQEETTIEETNIHVRGNVHSQGERAPRGFLQVTGPSGVMMPAKESGRRELGDWLASADNPLTARVFVNRVWHWLLGEGLVRTTDNFGTTGELASHPELLDHLAHRFVEEGWSVKRLVRRIVLSHTYQQSMIANAVAQGRGPDNRLLSHANRRRLDAEALRDTMLAVSGELTRDMHGPTYRAGLAADYNYRHADHCRSVYSPVFRNSLPELFEVFDFADPSISTGRRTTSTVAPQALFMMNHPFVLEQARQAARRLLPGSVSERLDRAYRLTLGRLPTAAERKVMRSFIERANSEDAWAEVFQVLFASVDFRYGS